MSLEQALDALARDREHGASEITARALTLLDRTAQQAEDPLEAVADAGADLIRAHPAMAPVIHLVDELLDAIETHGASAIDHVQAQRDQRHEAVVEAGAARVEDGQTIATYSRSGTVLAALTHAWEAGTRWTLVTSEARPSEEGLTVAREMAQLGAPVTLMTDVGLAARLEEADRLIVGADALCQEGLVNKIGTGVLAREADRAGAPVDVLATTEKRYPPELGAAPPLSTTASMGHPLPSGVQEATDLFEVAPWAPITAIVTEQGPTTPEAFIEQAPAGRLHPRLTARLGSA